MNGEKDINEWGADLEKRGPWILHTPTRVIGRVTKYECPSIDRSFRKITLESGHAFIANPENFVELSEQEVKFFVGCQQVMNGAIVELVKMGAQMSVRLPTITVIILGALQAQVMSLHPNQASDVM